MTGRQPPWTGKMWPVGRRGPWRLVLGASLALTSVAVALSPTAGAARRAAVAVPVRTLLPPGALDAPAALALDRVGDVFVADTGHCGVVEIPARSGRDYGVTLQRGHAVTVAGGRCAHGRIGHPTGLAVDVTGDVYLAEANDQRVQVLEPSGAIVTVAGTGVAGNGGNGGVATSAQLDEPTAVAVDRSGDVFIADTANCEVQVVAVADGQVLGRAVERPPLHRRRHRRVRHSRPGWAAGRRAALRPRRAGRRLRGRPARGRPGRSVRAPGHGGGRHVLRHRHRCRRHRRGGRRDGELRAVPGRRALGHERGGRAERPSRPRPRADGLARDQRRVHARDPDRPGPGGHAVRPVDDGGRPLHARGRAAGGDRRRRATGRAGC